MQHDVINATLWIADEIIGLEQFTLGGMLFCVRKEQG